MGSNPIGATTHIAVSFNGRTELSKSSDVGPIPTAAAIARWIRLLVPVLAVDVRARTLGYSETIRARSTRCIRATVKQYARLAWVYL